MIKRKLKWCVVIGLVMTLVLIVVAGCTGPAGPAGPADEAGPSGPAFFPGTLIQAFEKPTAPEPVVEATYTTVIPNLDGVVDPVWDRATELKVIVGGSFLDVASTGAEVTLKFLYSDENIYMLAQWPDPTYSIAKYEAWLWEEPGWHILSGSAAELEAGLTSGKSESGEFVSDDGLGVMWAINAPGFEEKGCVLNCHVIWKGEVDATIPEFVEWGEEVVGNPLHMEGACRDCHDTGELMWQQSGNYFDTPGEIADLWLMRAVRVMPLGFIDDWTLVYDAAPHTTMGGRKQDRGDNPYYHNRNRDQTAPLYMETNPTSYEDAMVTFESEIALGEAVAVAGLTVEQINEYWGNYQALRVGVATNYPKALVAARILKDITIAITPTDFRPSRLDVLLFAEWSAKDGGMWTAEYARKLVTGHDDDVRFDDFTAYYPFDIAVFDNSRGEGHSYHVGTPLNLVFAPPVVEEPPVVGELPVVEEPTAPGALPAIKFWVGDTSIMIEGGDLTPYGSGLTSIQDAPWTMTVEKGATIPLTAIRNTVWYSEIDHNLTIEGTDIDVYVPLGATEGPFEVTFNEVGTFKVYCSLHPDEHGETLIVVTEEGGALPTAPGALPPIRFVSGDDYIRFEGDDLSPYGTDLVSPVSSVDGPWTIPVEKGDTITITEIYVSGRPGTLDHNLTIEGTDIDVTLGFGEGVGPFEVTFNEVGTFKVFCNIHPDAHGESLIVVTEPTTPVVGEPTPEVGALPPITFKLSGNGIWYIDLTGDDLAPYGADLFSPQRDPWTITVEKGATIPITVEVSGRPITLDHNLTIEGTTIDVTLAFGESAGPFEVTFDEVGTFKVWCKLYPDQHEGGTIVVEE